MTRAHPKRWTSLALLPEPRLWTTCDGLACYDAIRVFVNGQHVQELEEVAFDDAALRFFDWSEPRTVVVPPKP